MYAYTDDTIAQGKTPTTVEFPEGSPVAVVTFSTPQGFNLSYGADEQGNVMDLCLLDTSGTGTRVEVLDGILRGDDVPRAREWLAQGLAGA